MRGSAGRHTASGACLALALRVTCAAEEPSREGKDSTALGALANKGPKASSPPLPPLETRAGAARGAAAWSPARALGLRSAGSVAGTCLFSPVGLSHRLGREGQKRNAQFASSCGKPLGKEAETNGQAVAPLQPPRSLPLAWKREKGRRKLAPSFMRARDTADGVIFWLHTYPHPQDFGSGFAENGWPTSP